MGWWLLFASIGISLSAWTSDTPSYAGQSGAAGLAIEDTTVVSCEKADSSYGFWISTLQLQILSNYPGSVIAVSPTPPLSYVFSGNCSDTLVFDFQITPLPARIPPKPTCSSFATPLRPKSSLRFRIASPWDARIPFPTAPA